MTSARDLMGVALRDSLPSSEQWEHATRTVGSSQRDFVLRDMGKQGWELVDTADNGWTLFFKRRRK